MSYEDYRKFQAMNHNLCNLEPRERVCSLRQNNNEVKYFAIPFTLVAFELCNHRITNKYASGKLP